MQGLIAHGHGGGAMAGERGIIEARLIGGQRIYGQCSLARVLYGPGEQVGKGGEFGINGAAEAVAFALAGAPGVVIAAIFGRDGAGFVLFPEWQKPCYTGFFGFEAFAGALDAFAVGAISLEPDFGKLANGDKFGVRIKRHAEPGLELAGFECGEFPPSHSEGAGVEFAARAPAADRGPVVKVLCARIPVNAVAEVFQTHGAIRNSA